jgi:hypothetical protein
MIRTLLLTVALGVAACGAANQSPKVASTEDATLFRGQACVRDSQCRTLNCVDNVCSRREP